jgi:hypothetical protein
MRMARDEAQTTSNATIHFLNYASTHGAVPLFTRGRDSLGFLFGERFNRLGFCLPHPRSGWPASRARAMPIPLSPAQA